MEKEGLVNEPLVEDKEDHPDKKVQEDAEKKDGMEKSEEEVDAHTEKVLRKNESTEIVLEEEETFESGRKES